MWARQSRRERSHGWGAGSSRSRALASGPPAPLMHDSEQAEAARLGPIGCMSCRVYLGGAEKFLGGKPLLVKSPGAKGSLAAAEASLAPPEGQVTSRTSTAVKH